MAKQACLSTVVYIQFTCRCAPWKNLVECEGIVLCARVCVIVS